MSQADSNDNRSPEAASLIGAAPDITINTCAQVTQFLADVLPALRDSGQEQNVDSAYGAGAILDCVSAALLYESKRLEARNG